MSTRPTPEMSAILVIGSEKSYEDFAVRFFSSEFSPEVRQQFMQLATDLLFNPAITLDQFSLAQRAQLHDSLQILLRDPRWNNDLPKHLAVSSGSSQP